LRSVPTRASAPHAVIVPSAQCPTTRPSAPDPPPPPATPPRAASRSPTPAARPQMASAARSVLTALTACASGHAPPPWHAPAGRQASAPASCSAPRATSTKAAPACPPATSTVTAAPQSTVRMACARTYVPPPNAPGLPSARSPTTGQSASACRWCATTCTYNTGFPGVSLQPVYNKWQRYSVLCAVQPADHLHRPEVCGPLPRHLRQQRLLPSHQPQPCLAVAGRLHRCRCSIFWSVLTTV
jgi:hypothetical protein